MTNKETQTAVCQISRDPEIHAELHRWKDNDDMMTRAENLYLDLFKVATLEEVSLVIDPGFQGHRETKIQFR